MKIIFLDVDGVLNDHSKQSNGYCGIKKECVENLNLILNAIPDINIVISSAWRYMIPNSMTLQGFEYMLLVSGINCAGRLFGYTRRDSITENDDRGDQIKDFLKENPTIEKYLIIDDMTFNYESLNLIHYTTHSKRGLTFEDADNIIHYLKD